MRLLEAWFARRTTVGAALCMIAVLVAASLHSVQLGPSRTAGSAVFSVSIQYFGVDPEAMERRITIPLEDAVSALPGISRLRCISEYGKSTVEVTLSPSVAADSFYLALRDAVNALHASLPAATQRPEILCTSSRDRPFYVAAVTLAGATLDQTREYVDAEVKPAVEQVEGVGEVEVGGGSPREVRLAVDQSRAAAKGLSLPAIASVLQEAYLLRPVGRLRTEGLDIPVILQGRLASPQALASLPVHLHGSQVARLDAIADARYGVREPDTVSRIDGERRITLYIKASGSANLVAVSAAIRARLMGLTSQRVSFETIYDLGSEITRSISEVLRSLAIAAGVVSLFVALALRPLRNAVLLALLLPSVVLITAAILAALAVGIDQNVLAGVAVGVGLVVDPGIVVASALAGVSQDHPRGATPTVVGELISPLAASTATTSIVLVPLFFLGRSTDGLSGAACAIVVMLLSSLALAVLFLPVFAGRERHSFACGPFGTLAKGPPKRRAAPACARLVAPLPPRSQRRAYRSSLRALDRIVIWAALHSGAVLAGSAALCALGLFAAARMDLLLAEPADGRSVYAHLEFPSGTALEATDRRSTALAQHIRGVGGVSHVETIARRESAGMTVALDGSDAAAERVRSELTAHGSESGAFVYLPESSDGSGQSIEVSLLGPDDPTLRTTAARVAGALRREPWVSQVVLNYKEGPPAYLFAVDHQALSNFCLNTDDVAEALRWGIHGPVALKWLESGAREIDLRVLGRSVERSSLHAIEGTTILGRKGRTVPLSELGGFLLTQPPSHIYREGRQRAVSFTVHTTLQGTGVLLSKIESFLQLVSLPTGYAFRMDRQVYEHLDRLRTLGLLLTAALGLIFITLAAHMESLSSPLLVMSIVPVSLSVPVTLLWISGAGIDVPVIVSLIIMSGIVVNNAILILDRALARCEGLGSFSSREVLRSIRFAVRRRSRALFLTSATTVLGVLPFLLGGTSGPALFRPLAIVLFYGTLASVFATFLVVPAVGARAPVFARRYPRIRG